MQVGSLDTKKSAAPPTPPASPKAEAVKPKAESGAVAAIPGEGAKQVVDHTDAEALEPYGDLIPFADPSWYQGVCCPILRVSRAELTIITVPLPILQRNPCRSP